MPDLVELEDEIEEWLEHGEVRQSDYVTAVEGPATSSWKLRGGFQHGEARRGVGGLGTVAVSSRSDSKAPQLGRCSKTEGQTECFENDPSPPTRRRRRGRCRGDFDGSARKVEPQTGSSSRRTWRRDHEAPGQGLAGGFRCYEWRSQLGRCHEDHYAEALERHAARQDLQEEETSRPSELGRNLQATTKLRGGAHRPGEDEASRQWKSSVLP